MKDRGEDEELARPAGPSIEAVDRRREREALTDLTHHVRMPFWIFHRYPI